HESGREEIGRDWTEMRQALNLSCRKIGAQGDFSDIAEPPQSARPAPPIVWPVNPGVVLEPRRLACLRRPFGSVRESVGSVPSTVELATGSFGSVSRRFAPVSV